MTQLAPDAQPVGTAKSTGLALALGIAALIAPVFFFLFFPLVGILGLGGVVAVVLALRARRRGNGSPAVVTALVLGAVGAVVDTVLMILMAVTLLAPGPTEYRIETQGGPIYSVTYSVGSGSTTEEWSSDWFREGTTDAKSVEITLTPPADADIDHPLSCRILWDGVVVSEETAATGPVTCSYDD